MAGRPTKYKEEYADLVYKFSLLGATDEDLAKFFDVNEDTIHEWKKVHPEFSESIKKGKEQADANVADRLYQRAMGYEHKEDKMFCFDGKIISQETTKVYPPDPTAAIFWLKNRQPKKWRDKQEHSIDGNLSLAPTINILPAKNE